MIVTREVPSSLSLTYRSKISKKTVNIGTGSGLSVRSRLAGEAGRTTRSPSSARWMPTRRPALVAVLRAMHGLIENTDREASARSDKVPAWSKPWGSFLRGCPMGPKYRNIRIGGTIHEAITHRNLNIRGVVGDRLRRLGPVRLGSERAPAGRHTGTGGAPSGLSRCSSLYPVAWLGRGHFTRLTAPIPEYAARDEDRERALESPGPCRGCEPGKTTCVSSRSTRVVSRKPCLDRRGWVPTSTQLTPAREALKRPATRRSGPAARGLSA